MRRESFAAGFAAGLVIVTMMLIANFMRRTPDVVITNTEIATTTSSASRGGDVVSASATPPLVPELPAPVEQAEFVGNTNSRKFHRIGCRAAIGCSNCTAQFATREEALKNQFIPCRACNP